jgi:uncharacterized protein YqeY
MSLKATLQDDLKAAMKEGRKRKLAALRLTLASIKVSETAETRSTHGDLTDEEVNRALADGGQAQARHGAELKGRRPEMLADEKQSSRP